MAGPPRDESFCREKGTPRNDPSLRHFRGGGPQKSLCRMGLRAESPGLFCPEPGPLRRRAGKQIELSAAFLVILHRFWGIDIFYVVDYKTLGVLASADIIDVTCL